jgi:hypothetical protein
MHLQHISVKGIRNKTEEQQPEERAQSGTLSRALKWSGTGVFVG